MTADSQAKGPAKCRIVMEEVSASHVIGDAKHNTYCTYNVGMFGRTWKRPFLVVSNLGITRPRFRNEMVQGRPTLFGVSANLQMVNPQVLYCCQGMPQCG